MQKKYSRIYAGDKFGDWIALEDESLGQLKIKCQCICGLEKEVQVQALTAGKTHSCVKCANAKTREKERYGKYNLLGAKFGRLTVIAYAGTKNQTRIWKCRCDCGKEIAVQTTLLLGGATKSCGCLRVDLSKKARNNPKFNDCIREFIRSDRVEGTRISTLDSSRRSDNTSGVRGVIWDKTKGKWRAQIHFCGKDIYLGRFLQKEDAIKARRAAEDKYFKCMIEKHQQTPSL